MATRGIKGFKLDGKYYGVYNYSDSCPQQLGKEMIEEARNALSHNSIEIAKRNIRGLTQVDSEAFDEEGMYSRTQESEYLSNVFSGKENTFHNEIGFIEDSLFCEYAYIIDFDDKKLMLFDGFQEDPQENNPFGTDKNDSGYYPCKHIDSIDVMRDDALKLLYMDYGVDLEIEEGEEGYLETYTRVCFELGSIQHGVEMLLSSLLDTASESEDFDALVESHQKYVGKLDETVDEVIAFMGDLIKEII